MIKAVIFDFFGVLALRGLASFKQTYLLGDEEKLNKVSLINDLLNRGELGYDDYIDQLASIGGVARNEVLKFTEEYEPNKQLLDYISGELKPAYKIGIISNAGQDWVLKILGGEHLSLFDDVVLSYKVGLIKPEPEIYELSARNIGVKPGECIFVDDILRYCQGAEQVGMSSVWYQQFEQFKNDIEKALSAVPNN